MNIIEELVLTWVTAAMVMIGYYALWRAWIQRPAVGWDEDCQCWRSARRIYGDRRWR